MRNVCWRQNIHFGARGVIPSRRRPQRIFQMDYSELVSFESDLASCYEAEYLLSLERQDASLGSVTGSQVGWLFPDQVESQRNHPVASGISPHCDSAVNCTLVGPGCTLNCAGPSVFTANVPSRLLHNSWTPPTAAYEADNCASTRNCVASLTADGHGAGQSLSPCQRKRKCVNSNSTAQLQADALGSSNSAVLSLWGALVGGVAHANEVAGTVTVGPVLAATGCGGVCGSLPAAKRHKAETSMSTGLYY